MKNILLVGVVVATLKGKILFLLKKSNHFRFLLVVGVAEAQEKIEKMLLQVHKSNSKILTCWAGSRC